MSASERLRSLATAWRTGEYDMVTVKPTTVLYALPQIAAVVEAAEATSACLPGLHDNSLRHSLEIQRGALAALDEALGEGK